MANQYGVNDFFDPAEDPLTARGRVGSDQDQNKDANPDWSPDGGGEQVVNGQRVAGTNAYDRDVTRDRGMGEAAQMRQAVQLDQTQANQSRGIQMGALGLLGQAARGQAPSRAAALGQVASDDAARSGAMAVGGGRGPAGSLLAMHAASPGLATTMSNNVGQTMDQRAQEMGRARALYAGAAQQARGQDIDAATRNAQLEAQQRALNEARQQNYERLAWDTRNSQQQAADDYRRQGLNLYNNLAAIRNQQKKQTQAIARDWENTVLASGMALSDERAKSNICPVGSLAHLMRRKG